MVAIDVSKIKGTKLESQNPIGDRKENSQRHKDELAISSPARIKICDTSLSPTGNDPTLPPLTAKMLIKWPT